MTTDKFNGWVAVYCASSTSVHPKYFAASEKLSAALATHGFGIVYGGGSKGLMGAVADEMLRMGGRIRGIIPTFMTEVEWHHKGLNSLQLVETMAERKMMMVENTVGVVALPGGVGTLEEILEVISHKRLGLYFNPVIFLNIDGYFNPLIEMLERMVEEKFMRVEHLKLWSVAKNAEEVIELIKNTELWPANARNFAGL